MLENRHSLLIHWCSYHLTETCADALGLFVVYSTCCTYWNGKGDGEETQTEDSDLHGEGLLSLLYWLAGRTAVQKQNGHFINILIIPIS